MDRMDRMDRMERIKFSKIRKGLSVIFFITLLLASTLLLQSTANANNNAVVKVDILNVRSGPGLNFKITQQIKKGETYPILDEKESWAKIKINSEEGWVANWLVDKQIQSTSSTSTPSSTTSSPNKLTIESNVPSLNVRSGPSTSFAILQKIDPGTKYLVTQQEGEWLQIQLNEDKKGWVANWLVTLSNDVPSKETLVKNLVTVQVDILNVRANPSTDSAILGKLHKGDQAEVLDIKDGWYQIDYKGQKGWIASQFATQDKGAIPSSPTPNLANQPMVTILNPGTNLREGPSLNQKVVARANTGDQFPIIETFGDWYHIQLANGQKAYVAGWIVSVNGLSKEIKRGIEKILENKVIIVDAGHGGIDHGATGKFFNSIEKNLNLDVAKRLEQKLKAAGARVIMTRTGDSKISLQGRVDIGIIHYADAFISVHHNTNASSQVSGTITYFYNEADKELAIAVQKHLVKSNGLKDLKARYGNYFVLRENPKKSILVELAFLTNYNDELKANQNKFQENSAEGIFQGVLAYFEEN